MEKGPKMIIKSTLNIFFIFTIPVITFLLIKYKFVEEWRSKDKIFNLIGFFTAYSISWILMWYVFFKKRK